MQNGFIYIASNSALKSGLLKIGLTEGYPHGRIESLSKSTSIPSNYKLEYCIEVSDVQSAEIRIHLLLADCRYNPSKEFFKIGLKNAIFVVKRVACYLDVHEYHSESYGFHGDYLNGRFEGKLSATPYRFMHLLASLSIGQHLADHALGFPEDLISGFAKADFCAQQFLTTRKSAMAFMRNFCMSYDNVTFLMPSRHPIRVFDYLRYYRGHMAWRYSRDFRPLIQNEKI